CGVSGDHATETAGHLHLLRGGVLHVERPGNKDRPGAPPLTIAEPSVLFYPRPCPAAAPSRASVRKKKTAPAPRLSPSPSPASSSIPAPAAIASAPMRP